jgi:glycine/D-amino acid oxidase-like deaminating enzyme
MAADVLVVGGGLVGTTTALFLAREGLDVIVAERGILNGRASGANAGSLHLQIPYPEFVAYGEGWARGFASVLPLLGESVGLWRELEAELGDIELAITGGLTVARTEAELAAVARKAAIERQAGLAVEIVDRATLRALAPTVSEVMIGGSFAPGEGKANPLKAGPLLVAAARRAGARLLERAALTALERDGAGFRAVVGGRTVRAGRVVNAAGADAGRVARLLGLDLAVEGFAIQATVTEPVGPVVGHLLYSAAGKLTLKQMANGTVVIGGGWPAHGAARLSVNPVSLAGNMRHAIEVVPALAAVRAVRTWPAIVNGTADWLPLVGEAPEQPGFHLALFPWIGFTAAPVAARMVADLILGRRAPRLLAHA